jgi:hypothetical protein
MEGISLAAPPTSFEALAAPTYDEAVNRLMTAAKFASDDPVHDSFKWHSWFQWQCGIAVPLDMFTYLASALDALSYAEVYDHERIPDVEAEVSTWRQQLTGIIVTKIARKGR